MTDRRDFLKTAALGGTALLTSQAACAMPTAAGSGKHKPDAATAQAGKLIVPKANAPRKPIEGLTVHAVSDISEIIELV